MNQSSCDGDETVPSCGTVAESETRADVILLRRLLAGRGALRFETRVVRADDEETPAHDAGSEEMPDDSRILLILQAFCGDGRMLVPLVEDGHVVVGLECDPASLGEARDRAAVLPPVRRSRVTLQPMGAATDDWPRGFDVVLLGANCLGEPRTASDREERVAAAALALKPGGYLFVDVVNMGCGGPTGIASLGRRIERSGFEIEEFLGDYAGTPYTSRSPRAIFWARKILGGASRQEQEWLLNSLGDFFDGQWITDVLHRVKGGKEANVYCCRAHPATGLDLLAAKVYRPRMFRTMKNNAIYKTDRVTRDSQGRALYDSRTLRALHRKTAFGRKVETQSWIGNEYAALQRLHRAGMDVVRPFAATENAILMEFVGDVDRGAPTLHEVRLDEAEAKRIFDRLMDNVALALEHDCIHADLSAHNVLYWNGEVRIIDMPQSVDPAVNPSAFFLLSRDVDRLCRYFARHGVAADSGALALDLWKRIVRGGCDLSDPGVAEGPAMV